MKLWILANLIEMMSSLMYEFGLLIVVAGFCWGLLLTIILIDTYALELGWFGGTLMYKGSGVSRVRQRCVQLLSAALFGGVRSSGADATQEVLADRRPVMKLVWMTKPVRRMDGIFRFEHSFVGICLQKSEQPVYVLESTYENSALVTHWRVSSADRKKMSIIASCNIEPKLDIRTSDLWRVARQMGPYDLLHSNSDHLARNLFMEFGARTPELPNTFFCSLVASILYGPLHSSESPSFKSESTSSMESEIDFGSGIHINSTKRSSWQSSVPYMAYGAIRTSTPINFEVYRNSLMLLSDYALTGFEGKKFGCIVFLGNVEPLLQHGRLVNPTDPFASPDAPEIGLLNPKTFDKLRRMMNASGIILIDGATGNVRGVSFKLDGPLIPWEQQAFIVARLAKGKGITLMVPHDSVGELQICFGRNVPRMYCRPLNHPQVRDSNKDSLPRFFSCDPLVPESWVDTPPFPEPLPATVDEDVYLETLDLASDYAVKGVPSKGGARAGCTLALGLFEAMCQDCQGNGKICSRCEGSGFEDFCIRRHGKHDADSNPFKARRMSIMDQGQRVHIQDCMNNDGVLVISGANPGLAVAAGFNIEGVPADSAGEGKRHKSCAYLARSAHCVVLNIPRDSCGQVDVYIGDQKTTYCKLLSRLRERSKNS